MTALPETKQQQASPVTMTVGVLREVLAGMAPDVELQVGVWDANRFNILIGTLPVSVARVNPTPQGGQLLLRVPGIS